MVNQMNSSLPKGVSYLNLTKYLLDTQMGKIV